MKIILLILFIYFIFMISKKNYTILNFYDNNVLNNFTLENLKQNYGNMQVEINEYEKNSMYRKKVWYDTLNNFLNKNFNINKNYKYQVKILDQFNLSVPEKYSSYKIVYEKIRISMIDWNYPEHFDCIDQIAIVLFGERTFNIDGNNYHLKAGDGVFIPMGIKHSVKADKGEFSILVTFGLWNDNQKKDYEKCNKKFLQKWKNDIEWKIPIKN